MAGGDNHDKNKDGEGSSGGITYDSPYYLHPSDYPKQLHVNEVLTDNNFADWNQEMTNFLFAKNKIEFVDGTIKKPEKTSKDYMPWMRVDAMIKGWLTAAMEKNIRNSVKYAGTASEIWSDLNERFGKESAPRAYELKQKIASTRQGGASVSTYFTQLRSIWDETQSIYPFPRCSCNKCECDIGKKISEYQEKERLYEFLMGLDVGFSVIRTQILATKPVPSLGTAYHMVAEDERQRAISNENTSPHESAAFKAFQRWNGPPSTNKERSGTKAVKDGTEHCTECNKDGHKREGCFKLIGYPEWWPGKKGERAKRKAGYVETETSPIPGLTNEDYQYFLKYFSGTGNGEGAKPVANMAHKEDEEGEWILDSGCTEYITCLSNALVNKKTNHFESPVVIPNGDSIPVKGKGDCVLPGGTKVNGVLYVPYFKCNLLSVSRLCRDLQCSMSFFPDFCIMQGLKKRNLIGNDEGGTEEPTICHDCHCHDEQVSAQNKEQNSMGLDQQMGHDQTNEPNGPHETDNETNDEGQVNNDGFEANESNEEAEVQVETRPTRARTQPSKFKDFVRKHSMHHKKKCNCQSPLPAGVLRYSMIKGFVVTGGTHTSSWCGAIYEKQMLSLKCSITAFLMREIHNMGISLLLH
ncbi:GAG-pre-integrase domain, Gag-polypeptide of LTR copia-type [Artemisia annua]|uniref:GAG-pre-integrase domain, Gag-polypeptide of LTR copia-type n=1 Tax=Artemisia annua TaxID=35608 RepID=A0A2U1NN49_ARTAN|nr:GAG-pre-integrase domain, Gag-polypeptide of LTR copia-type [Artemisia annua]